MFAYACMPALTPGLRAFRTGKAQRGIGLAHQCKMPMYKLAAAHCIHIRLRFHSRTWWVALACPSTQSRCSFNNSQQQGHDEALCSMS